MEGVLGNIGDTDGIGVLLRASPEEDNMGGGNADRPGAFGAFCGDCSSSVVMEASPPGGPAVGGTPILIHLDMSAALNLEYFCFSWHLKSQKEAKN